MWEVGGRNQFGHLGLVQTRVIRTAALLGLRQWCKETDICICSFIIIFTYRMQGVSNAAHVMFGGQLHSYASNCMTTFRSILCRSLES